MSATKTTEDIGVFFTSIYREGSKWWLSVSADWTHVILDSFKTKRLAVERLEEIRGILSSATHDEANKLFDVRNNLPHSFRPGSVDRLDYSRA